MENLSCLERTFYFFLLIIIVVFLYTSYLTNQIVELLWAFSLRFYPEILVVQFSPVLSLLGEPKPDFFQAEPTDSCHLEPIGFYLP